MDEFVRSKQAEVTATEERLRHLKQECEPYKAQMELDLIHELMPEVIEKLRIAHLCKQVGIAIESIKHLLAGKSLSTSKPFALFSPGHNRKFTVENMRLKMEQEPDNPNRLRLVLNGVNILDWFREKAREVKQRVMPKRSGGMKI
jgi:DNA-binding transcriptional MerR regulator